MKWYIRLQPLTFHQQSLLTNLFRNGIIVLAGGNRESCREKSFVDGGARGGVGVGGGAGIALGGSSTGGEGKRHFFLFLLAWIFMVVVRGGGGSGAT